MLTHFFVIILGHKLTEICKRASIVLKKVLSKPVLIVILCIMMILKVSIDETMQYNSVKDITIENYHFRNNL